MPLAVIEEQNKIKCRVQHFQTIHHILKLKRHVVAVPVALIVRTYVQGFDERRLLDFLGGNRVDVLFAVTCSID